MHDKQQWIDGMLLTTQCLHLAHQASLVCDSAAANSACRSGSRPWIQDLLGHFMEAFPQISRLLVRGDVPSNAACSVFVDAELSSQAPEADFKAWVPAHDVQQAFMMNSCQLCIPLIVTWRNARKSAQKTAKLTSWLRPVTFRRVLL